MIEIEIPKTKKVNLYFQGEERKEEKRKRKVL